MDPCAAITLSPYGVTIDIFAQSCHILTARPLTTLRLVCVCVSGFVCCCQVRFVSGLVALINEQLGSDAQEKPSPAVEAHYRNTIGEGFLPSSHLPIAFYSLMLAVLLIWNTFK